MKCDMPREMEDNGLECPNISAQHAVAARFEGFEVDEDGEIISMHISMMSSSIPSLLHISHDNPCISLPLA